MSKTEAMSKTIIELEDELGDAEAELVRYSTALEGYRTFEESGVEAVKRMRAELAAKDARIAELEAERRDRFFEDLANNMPDEFGD